MESMVDVLDLREWPEPKTISERFRAMGGLIRVHDIPAQRGFGEERSGQEDEDASATAGGSRLSEQLRSYYAKHLDPAKGLDVKDLGALQAIEAAQDAFDKRLSESFKAALSEVEGLGYLVPDSFASSGTRSLKAAPFLTLARACIEP